MASENKFSRANWFFWGDVEKDNVRDYEPVRQGYGTGMIDKLMYPMMVKCASVIPDTVAPNVITVAGLVSLLHGAYLSHKHSETYPVGVAIACSLLVTAYYVLDAVDGLHAERIRNRSNIGYLLITSVNSFTPVLLMVILCRTVLGITHFPTIWYAVQSFQLFFLFAHIRDLHGTSRHIAHLFMPGPAAIVPLFPVLCLARAAFAYCGSEEMLQTVINMAWGRVEIVVDWLTAFGFEHAEDIMIEAQAKTWHDMFFTVYVMNFVAVLCACLIRPMQQKDDKDLVTISKQTQNRLLVCLIYRVTPGMMLLFGLIPEVSMASILVDGLFLSVMMTDMVVGRMARRSLHPWIILFCMVSVLDLFVETMLCFFYFSSIFYDLSEHFKMPLFTVQRNVYVDGIYDLCHVGHMRMFAASAKYGNALFVGVVNDEDATPYKRKPIMTHEERCTEVAACKYVTKVIPNAPPDGIPRDFIEKHNIHTVVCGEEYFNRPNDHYYRVPREMGILNCAPRTEGISTSELINRILAAEEGSLAPKDKQRGDSAVKC
eukprot:TRINITY_DN18765_c0_g2_i1.p1 TRINITY_DN18765_c0_g2~~TRINITY_DN18765_c0_g2_i1.p1  ORF type:complete len:554 (+),score=101.94 TRINITY_DN18765_c0_g2_i1:36-1664(+)